MRGPGACKRALSALRRTRLGEQSFCNGVIESRRSFPLSAAQKLRLLLEGSHGLGDFPLQRNEMRGNLHINSIFFVRWPIKADLWHISAPPSGIAIDSQSDLHRGNLRPRTETNEHVGPLEVRHPPTTPIDRQTSRCECPATQHFCFPGSSPLTATAPSLTCLAGDPSRPGAQHARQRRPYGPRRIDPRRGGRVVVTARAELPGGVASECPLLECAVARPPQHDRGEREDGADPPHLRRQHRRMRRWLARSASPAAATKASELSNKPRLPAHKPRSLVSCRASHDRVVPSATWPP